MNKIIISLDIIWSKKNYDTIIFKNGTIVISENQITVIGEITPSESRTFSTAYPANIDLYADMKKNIQYSNAKIGDQCINLKTSQSHVLTWNSTDKLRGKIIMSWTLSELSYTYNTQQIDDFVILNLPFDRLVPKIIKSKNSIEDNAILVKNNSRYEFYKKQNINISAIKAYSDNKYAIDEMLIHLSFYLNVDVNVFMKSIYKENKINVSIFIPLFEMRDNITYHPELIYMNIGENNGFEYFFKNSLWESINNAQKEKLRQAVYTFIRCKYCDNTMQFILLYSILDSYAGNSYGTSPYKTMKDNLYRYRIDINKIGRENEPLLQKMQLYLKRDNGRNANVTNFCLLRNYILHFMSSPQIDEYLKRSNIVSKLRFAVCVIILNEFGFQNLSFKEGWQHLSILKDK